MSKTTKPGKINHPSPETRNIFKQLSDDLSLQEKLFFSWLCCVRFLPFIAKPGNFDYWINITASDKGDFRQEYLYTLFHSIDLVAKTVLDTHSIRDFIINGSRSEAHRKSFAIERKMHNITNVKNDSNENYNMSNFESSCVITAIASVNYSPFYLQLNDGCNENNLVEAVNHSMHMTYAQAKVLSDNTSYPLEQLLIDDFELIKKDKISDISHDTKFYGPIWGNFMIALQDVGCEYWANYYASIFAQGFVMTESNLKELDRRLNVPQEIMEQGAAAVGRYMS